MITEILYPFARKWPVSSTYADHKARTPPSTMPGTDIAAPRGTPILSPIAGVVCGAKYRSAGGRSFWIEGDGVKVYLAHLSMVGALDGELVLAGDVVGLVGSTGRSTGPHLHLSAYVFNKRSVWARVDPETLWDGQG